MNIKQNEKPTCIHITCLIYSYLLNVRHPFDIIYLPNSCKASTNSFFLPSNDDLMCEVDFKI